MITQKKLKPPGIIKCAAIALLVIFVSGTVFAANDYYHYNRQDADDVITGNIVTAQSYTVALDYLPDGAGAALKGRLIAATGHNIYLQDAVDSSSWTKVGTVTDTMDAAFIKVSPDGTKVALGQGWGKDLLVFPLSLLTSGNITDITNNSETISFGWNTVRYYDAVWADNSTHLVINGGFWDDVNNVADRVGITCLDITDAGNTPVSIISNTSYPGASSGIALDGDKNLIFGNGYDSNNNARTGELVLLPASSWWQNSGPKTSGLPLAYSAARKFANNVLSAAHLGFDEEGNLHVGGGQFVNSGSQNLESGYAALISRQVISDTADAGIPLYQIDETNAAQYREIAPDSCRNDTATGVLSYKRSIAVNWIDGTGACTIGGNTDWWGPGVTSKLTVYRIDTARDGDNDGFADVDDHSPWTACSNNIDADNDGYGNIIDGDFNNDGFVNMTDARYLMSKMGTNDAKADMDGNGVVNAMDSIRFNNKYGSTVPFYNY